jgi:GNAT superfamily N-acetyltransferase
MMTFANGYHSLPPGKIAAVVTYLEMREKPTALVLPKVAGCDVRLVQKPELDWYKQLFRAVGENWLWFSRLSMDDDSLREIIHNPLVEVHVLMRGLMEIGFMELDFRAGKDCELAYFGLTSDAIGTGAGQHLMQFAIERAWNRAPTIQRFHVHTCTLDHPRAVGFYQRCGFQPYARAIEIADDPRLDGRLPRQAASWLPLL